MVSTVAATRRVALIQSSGLCHAIPPTAGARQKEDAERPNMVTLIAASDFGRPKRIASAPRKEYPRRHGS